MTTRDDEFYNLQDDVRKLRRELDALKNKNDFIPEFKFALREDLKDTGDLFLPKRATSGSAGWDVRCAQQDRKKIILRAGRYVKIPLGFRILAPQGYWLKLNPRSSTFAKKSLHSLYGVLDNDFRGSVVFAAQYLTDINDLGKDLELEFGEAIGQLIPVKLQNMNVSTVSNEYFDNHCKDEDNERKDGGFGSSDKGFIKFGSEEIK